MLEDLWLEDQFVMLVKLKDDSLNKAKYFAKEKPKTC